MSTPSRQDFRRDQAAALASRLCEPRRHLQVVAGPRQVGKTTLVGQVLGDFPGRTVQASADEPALRDSAWIAAVSISMRSFWSIMRRGRRGGRRR